MDGEDPKPVRAQAGDRTPNMVEVEEADTKVVDDADDNEDFEVIGTPSDGEESDDDIKVLKDIDEEIRELEVKDEKAGAEPSDEVDRDKVVEELVRLKSEFRHWTEVRAATIRHLRDIADYIDTVSKRTGITKMIGSGGGAVGGGLTVVGGLLTIMSAGAALPVLLVGTGIGLASGVTGGAAAIAEKIIKSRQMKEAEAALEEDEKATQHLEEKVLKLRESRVVREVASDLIKGGAGVTTDSIYIAGLIGSGGGAAGTFGKIGGEAVAKIFGEDVGKEVSKLLLHTSGRLLSGSVTVVLGGATMLYDIYKLNREMGEIAKLGAEGASEIRTIADQLEETLGELCHV